MLALLLQFAVEERAKAVQLTEIERTKVEKEVPIHQFRVDAEKVNGFAAAGMAEVAPGMGFQCDEVEAVLRDKE